MVIVPQKTTKLDLKDLKSRIDLRDVIAQFWGPGKRKGKADFYTAPSRLNERTPSFAVYADGYKDFGDNGERGDLFDWLCKVQGYTLPQAIDYVVAYLGNASCHPAPSRPHKTAAHEPPSAEWQKIMRAEEKRASAYLWSNSPEAQRVLDYLRHKRGLNDEAIRRWRLGYNPCWRKTTYRDPESGNRVWVAPGITIPWWIDGVLWGIRVRCRMGDLADWLNIPPDLNKKGEETAKYLYVGGSKQTGTLFNGDAVAAGRDVLLVEGEFDAILAQQIMDNRITVITLGSANNQLTNRWLQRFKDARRVYTLLDADQAGQAATREVPASLHSQPLTLPIGKDVTQFVVDHGGDLEGLIAKNGAWWPSGVPDTIRSALLTYFPGSVALVVELVNEALRRGLLNSDAFTIEDIQAAIEAQEHKVAASTLNRICKTLEGVFFSKVESYGCDEQLASSFEKKSSKGRKPTFYRILTVAEIKSQILTWAAPRIYEKCHGMSPNNILAHPTAEMLETLGFANALSMMLAKELDQKQASSYRSQDNQVDRVQMRARRMYKRLQRDLDDLHSTPLPERWPLGSAVLYRAAFFRATVEANPDERRSRKEICALLGIANGSIAAVVKRAKLKADPQQERLSVISTDQLQRQVEEFAYEVKGFPLLIERIRPDGQKKVSLYDKDTADQVIAHELAQKAEVCVVFQLPNKYVIIGSTPPIQKFIIHPADEQNARRSPYKGKGEKPNPDKRTFYGPRFNPRWVYDQLKLGVELSKSDRYEVRGNNLVDRTTGEILEVTDLQLLEILLGRPIQVGNDSDQNGVSEVGNGPS